MQRLNNALLSVKRHYFELKNFRIELEKKTKMSTRLLNKLATMRAINTELFTLNLIPQIGFFLAHLMILYMCMTSRKGGGEAAGVALMP